MSGWFIKSSLRLAFVLFVALMGTGCKKGPTLYPAEGKVTMNGQPAEGATVVFSPVGGVTEQSLQPSGIVAADGSFKLQTFPHGEGALPGDYKVVVTWLPADARKQENPINKAPAKYGSADTTPLTATVKEGPNTFPEFQLTK